MRKVIPFLKGEYFLDNTYKTIFNHISEFITKYNAPPTKEALVISVQNDNRVGEEDYKNILNTIDSFASDKPNEKWLLTETEKFCKDKAVYNAILKSISIIDGKDKEQSQDGIPSILQEALGVCFDNNVGHDYIDNAEDRFEFYHRVESRIPFDLDYFNKITNGGLPNKTLNVVLAGCVHPETKVKIRFRKKI